MDVTPRVVLVTGVARYMGSRLAAMLAADPSITRVIGVDMVAPSPALTAALGRTEFVRADIRNPIIAKVINAAGVDTVVHMNVIATPSGAGGRSAMKEINVIGSMQLLAACQKAPTVQRLVVKSTTAVYGSSPRDPAMFSEDMEPRALPRSGFAKDAFEVEGYVRGFGRRRPDVGVTMLRFTNFIGPDVDTPLTRYLSLPVVPTVLGFDPRLQFCADVDGLEVLRRATLEDHPGTFNVGGDGVLLLSQAIRRAGRLSVPILPPAVTAVGQVFRRAGLVDFSPEQMRFLEHGRAVDITALRTIFGFEPTRTTLQAFDEFVAARVTPVVPPDLLDRIESAARHIPGVPSAPPAPEGSPKDTKREASRCLTPG
ncbi:MAG: NAD-dependent epimerase/dehydratase family protein [Frankiaceae bacterium]